jgi:hypothetical protein
VRPKTPLFSLLICWCYYFFSALDLSEILAAGRREYETEQQKENKNENSHKLQLELSATFQPSVDDKIHDTEFGNTKESELKRKREMSQGNADKKFVVAEMEYLRTRKLGCVAKKTKQSVIGPKLLSYRPQGESIMATSGRATYFTRVIPLSQWPNESEKELSTNSSQNLLTKSIREIIEEAYKLEKREEEGKKSDLANLTRSSASEQLLWVEKYAPVSFVHLLTDDRTNRDALGWLKGWERYVRRPKATGCPEHTGLMLSGSSGIGKTVLAKVCASQAGFAPIVISAPLIAGKDEFIRKIVFISQKT